MAGAGYPVGLTIAPIMPVEGWQEGYGALIDDVTAALADAGLNAGLDLTVELITHRFTATSKSVLGGWYPSTRPEMDEQARTLKRTRFGGRKYVYPREVMAELRGFVEGRIAEALPAARILYWT